MCRLRRKSVVIARSTSTSRCRYDLPPTSIVHLIGHPSFTSYLLTTSSQPSHPPLLAAATMSRSPPPPGAAPGPHPTSPVLDSTAYPHLLDAIFAHAPPPALLALRAVSRACRDRADRHLAAHLILEDRGMGGRWFAAWHASLNPASRAARPPPGMRPHPAALVAATYNAYSVYTLSRRVRVLGAPAKDGYYNWQGFVRSGHGAFTPGAGHALRHTRVLDLVGEMGVLSDDARGWGTGAKFGEIPLVRLLAGPGGEVEERPPMCRALALFPEPGDMEGNDIAGVYVPAGCGRVVLNVRWHDAPGLVRTRLRELEGVRDVVLSFAHWRLPDDSAGDGGGGEQGEQGGGQGDDADEATPTLLHGPETHTPTYVPPDVERLDSDEAVVDHAETLPWERTGPRDNDTLRWQELAFLIALALSCGARVTIVDLDRVDPAWLDRDFAARLPSSARGAGGVGSAQTDEIGSTTASTAGTTAAATATARARAHADTLRDLKATLRGLRAQGTPSFWLVNGIRVYGLCTVVVPPHTRSVRFVTAAEYAAERARVGGDAALETDASVFAGV